MSYEIGKRLTVDALFYDVLSGEFTTPADSQRTHTLGRLACACFTKGERTLTHDSTTPLLEVQYTPSWASHVTALTYVEITTKLGTPQPPELTAIELKGQAGQCLYVAMGRDTMQVDLTDEVTELELASVTELDQARATVTDAAQRFFGSAALL